MKKYKWLIVGITALILATAIAFGVSAKTKGHACADDGSCCVDPAACVCN